MRYLSIALGLINLSCNGSNKLKRHRSLLLFALLLISSSLVDISHTTESDNIASNNIIPKFNMITLGNISQSSVLTPRI